METSPRRLYCRDFHRDFSTETFPWRLFHGDFIIGNLKFEAYFEVLYPLYVVDCLRTSNVHHCLSLVTIGCL